MDKRRLEARQKLKEATLEEYERAIKAAKLTPKQAEVIEYIIIKDEYEIKISRLMHIDESVVKNLAKQAYTKLAKVLLV